jgi:hypothetical protein
MTSFNVKMTLSDKARKDAAKLEADLALPNKAGAVERALNATAYITDQMKKGNRVVIINADGSQTELKWAELTRG